MHRPLKGRLHTFVGEKNSSTKGAFLHLLQGPKRALNRSARDPKWNRHLNGLLKVIHTINWGPQVATNQKLVCGPRAQKPHKKGALSATLFEASRPKIIVFRPPILGPALSMITISNYTIQMGSPVGTNQNRFVSHGHSKTHGGKPLNGKNSLEGHSPHFKTLNQS